jgi:hypothetical protein
MRRRLRSLTPLLWIVAVALIGARVTGAHLHLCLDGHEPRSSIRLSDSDSLCETNHDADEKHQDQDVDAVGTALAKKAAQDDSVAAPTFFAILVTLNPPPADVRSVRPVDDAHPTQPPNLLRPPSRGPPV